MQKGGDHTRLPTICKCFNLFNFQCCLLMLSCADRSRVFKQSRAPYSIYTKQGTLIRCREFGVGHPAVRSRVFRVGYPAIRSRVFVVGHPAIQSRAFGIGHPAIRSRTFSVGPTDSIQVQYMSLFKVRHSDSYVSFRIGVRN